MTRPTESIVRIIGEPVTPNEASVLAEQDKYQFQWWALGLVGARPVEQKKGADHGIDGKLLFFDNPARRAETACPAISASNSPQDMTFTLTHIL